LVAGEVQHDVEPEAHPREHDHHGEKSRRVAAQPRVTLVRAIDERQDVAGAGDQVVDPADRALEHLSPDDRHTDHSGDRRHEVDRPEDLRSWKLRREDARQAERRQHRERHGEHQEDHDVAQRQPERHVAGTDQPVLPEPVEVHQYLVAGGERLDSGVGIRGIREVETERLDVVVEADEGAARAGGSPVVETDDQREDQRTGEEEEETDQVGRQEREPAQCALFARRRAEQTPDVALPHEPRGEHGTDRECDRSDREWPGDLAGDARDHPARVGSDDEPDAAHHHQHLAGSPQHGGALRAGARGGDLSGDQHPDQPDGDDEERDEGLVQTLAEIADGPKGAELVQHSRCGNDERQVVDHQ
jgi:hypothetical protein